MPQFYGDRYPDTPRGRKERDAAFAEWAAQQKSRVAGQRELWRVSGFGPEKAALKQAMLDRAWELLDAGEVEAADAILEFLPEADAVKLLDEFFREE